MLIVLIVLLVIAIAFWVGIPIWRRKKVKKHKQLNELVERLRPEVESAFSEISSFYVFNHYINKS